VSVRVDGILFCFLRAVLLGLCEDMQVYAALRKVRLKRVRPVNG
jgi:hypothetical protein